MSNTAQDKANDAKRRNEMNKQARAAWQHEGPNGKSPFPIDTCNGKRSQALKRQKKK